MVHICVNKLTIIDLDNGLSPGRRQAIIWTSAGILLIGHLGTNFSEILIEIYIFSFAKMHFKLSSGNWRPFCLGLNVLTHNPHAKVATTCLVTYSTVNGNFVSVVEFKPRLSEVRSTFGNWIYKNLSRFWSRETEADFKFAMHLHFGKYTNKTLVCGNCAFLWSLKNIDRSLSNDKVQMKFHCYSWKSDSYKLSILSIDMLPLCNNTSFPE